MRNAALTLALVCLLLVSGCLGVTFDDAAPPTTDDPLADSGETATATGTPVGSTANATAAAGTAVPAKPNPWGDDPLVVGVEGPADRGHVDVVEAATAYWEQRARQYAGFDVDYRVVPDAEEPDLVVNFVDDVPACGDTHDAVGCAPLVTDAGQIDRPEQVYVKTGLSTESTTLVLRHELGHTLGLRHDDAPQDVMRAESVLYTPKQPNATDRDFPWPDSEFTVYVDERNVSDPAATREQVQHALTYYENGADGSNSVPGNLSFRFVDSPERADVVVQFSETSPCGQGAGSCFQTLGPDPDGDGAIETYATLRITLVDLDTPAVGWHVGNWLAYGLGMEDAAERPDPFRDASYRERRSEWWN
ncbi:hypothetical protein SAMN04487948_108109 [Halogranum amylolyticum]|uniref:Matrixin n=1 Tax=Halogranum amylolyticum TaxID=660520 RepID=A0A1H8TUW0_9EURY|nr:matrixin [Halogranum amylolyticum]SEO94208.1 hypothetical protein SAMN04487948_108109 [Halogranum amylolyticum]